MALKKSYSKTKGTCKVTFTLSVDHNLEHASEVKLLGTFNDWKQEDATVMKKKSGAYSVSIDLACGQDHEYRYLIDGHHWMNDPAADKYVPTQFLGVFNNVASIEAAPVKVKKASGKKTEAKKEAKTKEPFSDVATEKTVTKKAPSKKATAKKAPAIKTVKKSSTAKVNMNNLKVIEGVGPKIEGLLKEAGFETLEKLSKATKKQLTEVLSAAGNRYTMHDPSTWAKQAKLAAKGDKEALKKLQDELKGGRAPKK